jgi:hypothetical protein
VLTHGVLKVTLSRPAAVMTGKFGPAAMSESVALRNQVRSHRIKTLSLVVTTTSATGKETTLTAQIKHLR